MKNHLMEKLKWRMGKWLWDPPGEMPVSDPETADWIKPQGRPVRNKRWHLYRAGKGNPAGGTKPIEEFYHRGAYSRHEAGARHTPKAVMTFRGKGAKVERRSKRSQARRKQEG